ncbi:MAG: radical SAM protein [Halococcoides sp.]
MYAGIDTDDRPLLVIWELTQACDLACHHCRASARPQRDPDELSTAEAKALLEDIRAFGPGTLVVFSGGDPFKRDDVTELIAYGDELGLRMSLTPSGTRLIDREAVGELAAAGLANLAVSLDGPDPARHDAFREEQGSYEETIAIAEAAVDHGVSVQVNSTVCAETADDLPAIRDRVRELGAVRWSVFFLVPLGRGAILDPVSPDRAEAIWEWLAEVAERAPFALKTTEAPAYRRVRAQRGAGEGGDRPGVATLAGDGFVFVSHRGEIYPSGFLPQSAGSVRKDDLATVYREHPLFQSLRDRSQLTGKCGACEFREQCGGSRSRAHATTGDPLASDPLCPYVPDEYDGPIPGPAHVGD